MSNYDVDPKHAETMTDFWNAANSLDHATARLDVGALGVPVVTVDVEVLPAEGVGVYEAPALDGLRDLVDEMDVRTDGYNGYQKNMVVYPAR